MDISLYTYGGLRNVVNKPLSNETIYENCTIVEPFDIERPTFKLSTPTTLANMVKFNYLRWVNTDRYYFCKVTFRGGFYVLECETDPLMTAREDILNGTQLVLRNENERNKYMADTQLPLHATNIYTLKKVGAEILSDYRGDSSENLQIVLQTIGRGGE